MGSIFFICIYINILYQFIYSIIVYIRKQKKKNLKVNRAKQVKGGNLNGYEWLIKWISCITKKWIK